MERLLKVRMNNLLMQHGLYLDKVIMEKEDELLVICAKKGVDAETWYKNMGNCFDGKKQEMPTITLDNFLKIGNNLSLHIDVLRNLGDDYEKVFSGTIFDYIKLETPIEAEVVKWNLDFDTDVYMEIFIK